MTKRWNFPAGPERAELLQQRLLLAFVGQGLLTEFFHGKLTAQQIHRRGELRVFFDTLLQSGDALLFRQQQRRCDLQTRAGVALPHRRHDLTGAFQAVLHLQHVSVGQIGVDEVHAARQIGIVALAGAGEVGLQFEHAGVVVVLRRSRGIGDDRAAFRGLLKHRAHVFQLREHLLGLRFDAFGRLLHLHHVLLDLEQRLLHLLQSWNERGEHAFVLLCREFLRAHEEAQHHRRNEAKGKAHAPHIVLGGLLEFLLRHLSIRHRATQLALMPAEPQQSRDHRQSRRANRQPKNEIRHWRAQIRRQPDHSRKRPARLRRPQHQGLIIPAAGAAE
jgi:hypothetical protein